MVAIESFTVYGNGRLCDPVLDHELRQKEEALITAARQMTTSTMQTPNVQSRPWNVHALMARSSHDKK